MARLPDAKARIVAAIADTPQEFQPEAIVMSGPDGLVQWINPAFSAMCGYTLEELRGKKLGPILQGEKTDRETAARIRKAVHACRACRETILNYHKSGLPYWVEISITPICDESGEPLWLVAREREVSGLESSVTEAELCAPLELRAVHSWGSIISRSASIPRRMRALMVPSGSSRYSAISVCVIEAKKASSIAPAALLRVFRSAVAHQLPHLVRSDRIERASIVEVAKALRFSRCMVSCKPERRCAERIKSIALLRVRVTAHVIGRPRAGSNRGAFFQI